eukprot:TRINITY_DN5605_c0_g1_i1.p1 TRINITY_DN5605_c0_g1~~TRINITY_DN5605_c0_g1_i1.p1  ORF type:complete len:155 (-),score=4.85 TRINITY_DN5605_c0_g1_i1:4-468(-)
MDTEGWVQTLAGTGTQGFKDGAGNQAMFYYPRGLAVDSAAGLLYVADVRGIRSVTLLPESGMHTWILFFSCLITCAICCGFYIIMKHFRSWFCGLFSAQCILDSSNAHRMTALRCDRAVKDAKTQLTKQIADRWQRLFSIGRDRSHASVKRALK